MNNTPRLNIFLFGLYFFLVLCVGGAALIWPPVRSLAYAPLRDALLPDFYLNTSASIPVDLLVAVPPILEEWAKTSAADFTRQNPLITVQIIPLRGAEANRRLNTMTGSPDVWIAESGFARTAAGGIPYETTGAVIAQDSFVWAAVASSASPSDPINWRSLAQRAETDPQFRLAVPPADSIEGMGACLSAAAEFFQQDSITAEQIDDVSFRSWLHGLMDAVSDMTRNPRDQMASRPPQADAALLMNSDRRTLAMDVFFFQPPRQNVVFDFSFFIRADWREKTAEETDAWRTAAESFRTFLLTDGPQRSLADYGLDRSGTAVDGRLPPIDENTVRALQFCWRN